jgi:hypothetical protein
VIGQLTICWSVRVALSELEGSSNEETEFERERVRFSEKGCGCSKVD